MAAVLITGGTGYLGQFLTRHFAASGLKVGFTYWHCSEPEKLCCTAVEGFKVNLATGEGLDACLEALTAGGKRLVAVINCAALSQPAVCEAQPAAAAALNVPTKLLDALELHKAAKGCDPLLIHFSTDQVYDGSKARWKEGDECKPVNVYGRTKLEGERAVQAQWPNHAILRSSIIYGPDPPLVPVERPLLLQFIDECLTAKRPTAFFEDEWRCPVRVRDIIRVVQTLIARQGELQHRLFNLGGPDRLSRADMAEAVARAHGHDPSLVQRVPAASANRPFPSPADISMDSSRLEAELHLPLTPFNKALEHIFKDHHHDQDSH